MLKYFLYLLAAIVVVGLLAGGFHLFRVAQKNKKEMAQYSEAKIDEVKPLGKVLVIYYSLTGHTKDIAERIKKFTNADMYEIKTLEKIDAKPYFYMQVKKQLKDKNFPKLEGEMPRIDNYDIIFVGAPVWWYTIATPGFSFLEQMDCKGKKVVPFSTQGSNYGSFFEDFAKYAKNAKILESASFNNLPEKYNEQVDNKIAAWLNRL